MQWLHSTTSPVLTVYKLCMLNDKRGLAKFICAFIVELWIQEQHNVTFAKK